VCVELYERSTTVPLEDIGTWLGVATGVNLPIVFRHDKLHRVHSSVAYDITHEGMVTDEVTYLNQLMAYVKNLIPTSVQVENWIARLPSPR